MHAAVLLQSATFETVLHRARTLISSAAQSGLEFLLALLVVAVGWLIARLLSRLVLLILRAARFNAGMRQLMGAGGTALRYEPAAIGAWAVHWIVVALAVMLAADALGLDLSASVGERLREVLPRVIAATIELIGGIALAVGLGAVTQRVFEGAGFRRGRLRGQIVTFVLSAFTVLVALEQLGLAAQFIMALTITTIAVVGLAAAMAFGLGCRELARDFVVEYLRSLEDEKRGGLS